MQNEINNMRQKHQMARESFFGGMMQGDDKIDRGHTFGEQENFWFLTFVFFGMNKFFKLFLVVRSYPNFYNREGKWATDSSCFFIFKK